MRVSVKGIPGLFSNFMLISFHGFIITSQNIGHVKNFDVSLNRQSYTYLYLVLSNTSVFISFINKSLYILVEKFFNWLPGIALHFNFCAWRESFIVVDTWTLLFLNTSSLTIR